MFPVKANTAAPALGRACRLLIVDDSNLMRRHIERSQQFDDLEDGHVRGLAGERVAALDAPLGLADARAAECCEEAL